MPAKAGVPACPKVYFNVVEKPIKYDHTGSKKRKVKNYRAITQLENAFLVLYMGSY